MKPNPAAILLALDLAGTFLFGLEGASAAIAANLDVFGIMVLSFATALGGGVIRDLLIGATPPAAIRDPRYAIAAFSGGAIEFSLNQWLQQIPHPVIIGLDAMGLALFAVSGAAKALDYQIHPFFAVLLGAITGVGGGTIRDIFLARIPAILRVDVYAVAALAGALVMVVGIRFRLPRSLMMATGGAVCFLLRVTSVWRHWNLPTAIRP
jgi:uncharacterized membrane protein YeiH